jgi:hypothetical protein
MPAHHLNFGFVNFRCRRRESLDSPKEMAPQQYIEKDPFGPEPEPVAKKAAGFCANDGEIANMSAVLTGRGPIPKRVAT